MDKETVVVVVAAGRRGGGVAEMILSSSCNCNCNWNPVSLWGQKWRFDNYIIRFRGSSCSTVVVSKGGRVESRRSTTALLLTSSFPIFTLSVSVSVSVSPPPAEARRNRNNTNNIPIDQYLTGPDGLQYYDLVEGKGPVAEKGLTVQVHFDCLYRGVTAISSRESKLLAGNRSIAQPYIFTVGAEPGKERKRDFVDNPNGLFSAQAAPKPPPAMYSVVQGMRVGGKRTVIVPPEKGYGQRGMNEIPPGAAFQLNIELLQVVAPPT